MANQTATKQGLPVTVEITTYGGSCLLRQFRWLPDGTLPLDFTGWRASLLIGPARGDAVVAMVTSGISAQPGHIAPSNSCSPYCPDENAGIFLLPNGIVAIHLSDGMTADLPIKPMSYAVDLIDSAGTVTRFLRGRFRVVSDVRRPAYE